MQMMPSLQVKQKQALVMTPQLQQAIKLLQMTDLDICNFLQEQAWRTRLSKSRTVPTTHRQPILHQPRPRWQEQKSAAAPSAGEGSTVT
ncbi:MAG: hypothetical protein CM15mP115_12140 [Alphaproteobacteria bacterium]|nr:MAG: hypothetical protein CM15mP115_12140 [Alphaproteobacteria bacterium]